MWTLATQGLFSMKNTWIVSYIQGLGGVCWPQAALHLLGTNPSIIIYGGKEILVSFVYSHELDKAGWLLNQQNHQFMLSELPEALLPHARQNKTHQSGWVTELRGMSAALRAVNTNLMDFKVRVWFLFLSLCLIRRAGASLSTQGWAAPITGVPPWGWRHGGRLLGHKMPARLTRPKLPSRGPETWHTAFAGQHQ